MKKEFVQLSIEDIRDTIRAIDNKFNFAIAVIVLPLSILPEVLTEIIPLLKTKTLSGLDVAILITSALAAILWIASLFFVYEGLSSISNPADGIKSGNNPDNLGSQTFFSYESYKRTIQENMNLLPIDENNFVFELTFEQMKLARIRDFKIEKQRNVYYLYALFISVSTLGVILFLFKMSLTR